MNIFNHSIPFSKGNSQVSHPSGEDSPINVAQTLTEAAKNIRELVVGQIFQGEIMDIRNAQVFIGLSSGQTIIAKLSSQVDVYIGQTLSFQVKSNNGSQIEIKPLINNQMENPTLLKALEEAKLPVNEKNTNMVKYLMEAQMPIDRQSLQHINKQSSLYPDADIRSIVQMNKLQIPVTRETLVQFEDYKNYEHRIANEIEQISTEIPDVLKNLSNEDESYKAITIQKEIVKILLENGNARSLKEGQLSFVDDQDMQKVENTNSFMIDETIPEIEKGLRDSIYLSKENKTMEPAYHMIGKNPEENKINENLPLREIDEAFVADERTESGIARFMSEDERGVLIKELKSFPLSEETFQDIKKGTISEASLIEKITFALETKGTFLENDVKELFQNKEYHKVLSEFIKESWLLKPEELLKEDSVKEFYDKLESQMSKMNQLMTQINQESASLSKFTTNVKDNVDFMNQLNQVFTYLQIPLKLKNGAVHSELFVYTNKKNLSKKDGVVSALLHLDMESLGTVDVYIDLKGQNLNTKFYLQNEESVKIIEDNIEFLNRELTKSGYQCSSFVMMREEKSNHMEDFLKINDSEGTVKRYTFDVRT